MKVPCHTCIVKARCMHRINKYFTTDHGVNYSFEELLQECESLREYFGVNTAAMKIVLRNARKFTYHKPIETYIEDKDLIKNFLKVMHKKEMPRNDYSISIRKRRKKDNV